MFSEISAPPWLALPKKAVVDGALSLATPGLSADLTQLSCIFMACVKDRNVKNHKETWRINIQTSILQLPLPFFLKWPPPQTAGLTADRTLEVGFTGRSEGLEGCRGEWGHTTFCPSFARDFVRLNPQPRKAPSTSCHYTGWLIRILRMVCYNPYMTG